MKKVILICIFMFLISLCYIYVASGLSLGYIDKDIRNDLLTNINEVKTTEVIVQQSPSGGGGGGGGGTTIIQQYYSEPTKKDEEEKKQSEEELKDEKTKSEVKEKSLTDITGAVISNLPKTSPIVGILIIMVITSSGLLIYLFVFFKKD